jgi:hypothetical protein
MVEGSAQPLATEASSLIVDETFWKKFKGVGGAVCPPGRKSYPPACKPYGLEAGLEATVTNLEPATA